LKAFLEKRLQSIWFATPSSWLDRLLLSLARPIAALAEKKIVQTQLPRRQQAPPVPVVVVGNLLVGGAGKTPAAMALAKALSARGFDCGLIASGYGSPAYDLTEQAILVNAKSRPTSVGDEPVLIAKTTGLPVAVSGQRSQALEALLKAYPSINLVVSDDGLQHVGLKRSIELCLIDKRGFGNGEVLPAGPLREPLASLARVDALLLSGFEDSPEFAGQIARSAKPAEPLLAEILKKPRFAIRFSALAFMPHAQWQNRETSKEDFKPISAQALQSIVAGRSLAAIAGTAQPEPFFAALRAAGLSFTSFALGDHAPLDNTSLKAVDQAFVIMTEKDAVKWPSSRAQSAWVAVRETMLDPLLVAWLVRSLKPDLTE
jgi:tetraacyldisaccharide 4'-kinase